MQINSEKSLPMPPKNAARRFCFGPFELNEATGELRKHGIRIKLHAQPSRVLAMLLDHPGELVTRQEMRQQLWGDDTIVDFDHGLNTAVNKLREALSDTAAQPRYVETISGRGYRFMAPVTVAAPTANALANPERVTPTVEASNHAAESPSLQLL